MNWTSFAIGAAAGVFTPAIVFFAASCVLDVVEHRRRRWRNRGHR